MLTRHRIALAIVLSWTALVVVTTIDSASIRADARTVCIASMSGARGPMSLSAFVTCAAIVQGR